MRLRIAFILSAAKKRPGHECLPIPKCTDVGPVLVKLEVLLFSLKYRKPSKTCGSCTISGSMPIGPEAMQT